MVMMRDQGRRNECVGVVGGSEAVRQPQVGEAIGRATSRAQHLAELADRLESRLAGVIQACPPTKEGNPNVQHTALVPVAEGIDRVSDSLDNTIHCLESLLSRLEV